MTNPKLANILNELFDYLGDDRWDLGELLADAVEGAKIYNERTKYLITEVFKQMPEPDNFTPEDLAREIKSIGTPFAVGLAYDFLRRTED